MTSGTRRAVSPHSRQEISTSSTAGRRGSTPPTSRPAPAEVLGNLRVGLLHPQAANDPRTRVGDATCVVDRPERRPPLTPTQLEVVRAVARRDVHAARALVHDDEAGGDHAMRVAVDVR